jgi:serine/threonine-protein kinase
MLLSVPGVIGLESNDARHTLEGAGLKVSVAYQESAEEQRGKVVGQQPGPDSQAPTGTEVALVVGAGVGEVQIPYELDGKPVEEVERTLHELGLVTTRADVERDGCREGTVFAFEPPRGTHVPKGSTVRLSVAKAPQRQPVDSSSILGSWRLSSPNTDSAWDFRADGTATWTEPSTGDTRVWHWRIENGTLRLEFDPSKIVYYEVWFQGPKLHWRSLDGAKHYVFGRR